MTAALPSVLDYVRPAPPAPGEAIEIAPRVLWLRMPLPFALDHINLWLLADGSAWTQVDCGYGDADTRTLWRTHFDTTFQGKPLSRVVVTHYHPDHIGNAAWLSLRFACPVLMPATEFLTAHAIARGQPGYDIKAMVALFRAHGLGDEHAAVLEARGGSGSN